MKSIVCISDTHNQHHKLVMPAADCVIHAGDISGMGREHEIVDFLRWFEKLPCKYRIFIAGNHDWLFQTHPGLVRDILEDYPGIIYLENSGVEIEGIKFYGSPVQPEFYQWAFNKQRGEEIKQYWDMIPADTDILITHGPPHKILDKTKMTKGHVGCEELLKRVNEIKCRFNIFGHIHSAAGIHKTEHTTFINASVLDDNYQMKYKPVIIEI